MGDLLQKSHVKSPKRAFRTRLPPKVTRQVSKTSVSCETSSKSHASSLQNERFVRDFLKNSHVKVCKTTVSYETSSKTQAETPIGAHTSRSPAKQFRDSSPSKLHPLTRIWHVTFSSEPSPKASPNGSALALYCVRLRTAADGCELRNNGSRTRLYPQTPRVKREPFATHSGKERKKVDHLRREGFVFWQVKSPSFR